MGTAYWLGTVDNTLDNAGNWEGGTLPAAGDDLVFNVSRTGWASVANSYGGGFDSITLGTIQANDGSVVLFSSMTAGAVYLTNASSTAGGVCQTIDAGSDGTACILQTTVLGAATLGGQSSLTSGATAGDYSVLSDSAYCDSGCTLGNYATLNDSAMNVGTAGDFLTCNDLSFSNYAGNSATFNDQSFNNIVVGDNATFNDDSTNSAANVGDNAVFNDQSSFSGGNGANATFNDDASILGGTLSGDIIWNSTGSLAASAGSTQVNALQLYQSAALDNSANGGITIMDRAVFKASGISLQQIGTVSLPLITMDLPTTSRNSIALSMGAFAA